MKKKYKKIINRLKKRFSLFLYNFIARVFKVFPLNEKKVLFLSDQRSELDGNFGFIYDYISKEDYVIIKSLLPNNFCKRSIKQKLKLVYDVVTSKYVLLDDWNKTISLIKPRKNQDFIQLWHGAGAFKKFGNARLAANSKGKNTGHQNYTKAIVSSEKLRQVYADSYGISINKVKATGIPRTDIFFDEDYKKQTIKNFYKKYPNLKGKKCILFAPTLRTYSKNVSSAYYDFEMLDLDMLEKELKDEYVLILKWHPFVYNKLKLKKLRFNYDKYKDFVIDMSEYREINDLLLIVDVLVTDYSSVIFDYCLLDKPIVFYPYDLEKYDKDRGFYFPYEEYTYGKVAFNPKELVKCIKDKDMMKSKRVEFVDKFMSSCDGNSTKKTVKYIFKDSK